MPAILLSFSIFEISLTLLIMIIFKVFIRMCPEETWKSFEKPSTLLYVYKTKNKIYFNERRIPNDNNYMATLVFVNSYIKSKISYYLKIITQCIMKN